MRSDGTIYAAKALVVIIPKEYDLSYNLNVGTTEPVWGSRADFLEILYDVGLKKCKVLFIHEKRPYPALVNDAAGETLCDLPGGVLKNGELSVVGGVREFMEELGADASAVVGELKLVDVPSPVSAGAQIEGYSISALLYKGNTNFTVQAEEGIARFEVLPLVDGYHTLKRRHENREECVDLKTLGALLMLERAYMDRFGKPIFSRE